MAALPLVFTFILFLAVSRYVGECLKVIVGDPFTFRANCQPEEEGQLLHVPDTHTTTEVAVHRDGGWTPARAYSDRVQPGSYVAFSRTVYTDRGLYELTCSSRVNRVQLEVVVPLEASVRETQTVNLQCYYSATDKRRWSVQWEKNDTVVFQKKSCSDEETGTEDDRLSLASDWCSHGNLSLIVDRAQMKDGGDYFCFVFDGEGGKKLAATVRLTVKRGDQDPPSHCPQWTESAYILIAVILASWIVLAVLWVWKPGTRCLETGNMV